MNRYRIEYKSVTKFAPLSVTIDADSLGDAEKKFLEANEGQSYIEITSVKQVD